MPEKVRKFEQAPKKGPGKYRKRLDLGKYRKGGIRASTGNVGSERVPEKGPGEYREGKIWVSTRKGRIPVSTGNVGSG